MKFVMNGCLIIGTMDGANVEICEEVGQENMFIFGLNLDQVAKETQKMKSGFKDYVGSRLGRVFNTIRSGMFGGNTQAFSHLINKLCDGEDAYLVCHDFYSYLEAQDRVDITYRDQLRWN